MWFRVVPGTSDMLVVCFQLYLKISFPETDWVVGADNTDWCHPGTLRSPSMEGMLLNIFGLGDAMTLALYPCHSTKGKHCYWPFVLVSAWVQFHVNNARLLVPGFIICWYIQNTDWPVYHISPLWGHLWPDCKRNVNGEKKAISLWKTASKCCQYFCHCRQPECEAGKKTSNLLTSVIPYLEQF